MPNPDPACAIECENIYQQQVQQAADDFEDGIILFEDFLALLVQYENQRTACLLNCEKIPPEKQNVTMSENKLKKLKILAKLLAEKKISVRVYAFLMAN